MNAIESIELSAAANHLNARRMAQIDRRVNAFLSLLLAVAVGLGLAFALIHFGLPCEGASLCAAVLPTQRSWLERIVLDLQRWRLLRHIRSAQQDLTYQQEALQLAQWECDHIPKQLDVTQGHIDQLCRQMDALDAPKVRP
jgi:hypothetical protein